jgi:hypothetical protein
VNEKALAHWGLMRQKEMYMTGPFHVSPNLPLAKSLQITLIMKLSGPQSPSGCLKVREISYSAGNQRIQFTLNFFNQMWKEGVRSKKK